MNMTEVKKILAVLENIPADLKKALPSLLVVLDLAEKITQAAGATEIATIILDIDEVLQSLENL